MSVKRDYKTKTDDNTELEPLGAPEPKSPDKENPKSNGFQFGKFIHKNTHKKQFSYLNI